MNTSARHQKSRERFLRLARQAERKQAHLRAAAQEQYGPARLRRVFWHGKTEYVANLPNTGLHSGHRLYFRGLTVGQVKKMVHGAKSVRRSAYGNVEVLHTNQHRNSLGGFRVLDKRLWDHITDK